MFKSLGRFLAYNNAVPLLFGMVFLGATGALAATPEGRDTVFSANQRAVAIDNSRIINVDVEAFPLMVQVTGVREDDNTYYVDYTLATIELSDGVWKDISSRRTLTVSKDALNGRDLGLYATQQIAEVRSAEKQRLAETQRIERTAGLSQKVVATEYSGLIGKFLDPTTETLPGYVPVIVPVEPPAEVVVTQVSNSEVPDAGIVAGVTTDETSASAPQSQQTVAGDPTDTSPPSLTVLGNNPARIAVGSSYADLGVLVTDDKSLNIGYRVYLDGNEVTTISLDTREPRIYTITYTTADQVGNRAEAFRTVEIYDPFAPATAEKNN